MALHHAEQHGRDAVARARRTFTPRWHPILAAQEVEPGHWIMVDTMDQPYGAIQFVRRVMRSATGSMNGPRLSVRTGN